MTIWWVPPWLINHGLLIRGWHYHSSTSPHKPPPSRCRSAAAAASLASLSTSRRRACAAAALRSPEARSSSKKSLEEEPKKGRFLVGKGGKIGGKLGKNRKHWEKLGKDWEKHVFPEKCGWKIGKTPGKRMEKVDKTWEKMGKESTQMGIIRCESMEGGKVFMWKPWEKWCNIWHLSLLLLIEFLLVLSCSTFSGGSISKMWGETIETVLSFTKLEDFESNK